MFLQGSLWLSLQLDNSSSLPPRGPVYWTLQNLKDSAIVKTSRKPCTIVQCLAPLWYIHPASQPLNAGNSITLVRVRVRIREARLQCAQEYVILLEVHESGRVFHNVTLVESWSLPTVSLHGWECGQYVTLCRLPWSRASSRLMRAPD
jgi:hypothetical protein